MEPEDAEDGALGDLIAALKALPGGGRVMEAVEAWSGERSFDGEQLASLKQQVVSEGNVSPEYPEAARKEGSEGVVLLRVKVRTDGTTTDIEVVEADGHPDLADAAVISLEKWTFEPAKKDGEPVDAVVKIPIRFALDGDKENAKGKGEKKAREERVDKAGDR